MYHRIGSRVTDPFQFIDQIMVKELVQILFPYLVVFRARLEIHQKGLFVDGAQMKDGKDENIEAFWIDNDDVGLCENNLMVTKSLKS